MKQVNLLNLVALQATSLETLPAVEDWPGLVDRLSRDVARLSKHSSSSLVARTGAVGVDWRQTRRVCEERL